MVCTLVLAGHRFCRLIGFIGFAGLMGVIGFIGFPQKGMRSKHV